jgi:hypothetical protein
MNKSDSIKKNLVRCRNIIEHKQGWEPNNVLTRREFELLIEKVFDKTGVLLSLSTIRRIWNNDFKNIPHKSTLDALAEFAGQKNWQSFVESQYKYEVKTEIKRSNRLFIIGIIISFVIILLAIVYQTVDNNGQIEIIGSVVFEYTQESNSTIPNIIVFDYDVTNIVADSFFIVESTNDYRKRKLFIKKGQMTSAYYRPGNYEAFLMADDSIIKKINIEILSNSWVAILNYGDLPKKVPFYYYQSDIIKNGKLCVTRNMIKASDIRIEDELYLFLSRTFNSKLSLSDGYIFETKIKLDSIEINASCPEIYIGLLFENDICYIPLVQFGGQDRAQLKFGRTYLSSNDSDLRGFGCNIYNWQKVKINSTNHHIEVLLNNKIITSFMDSTMMGEFNGFSFTFDGIGSVDYVMLSSIEKDTIYYNAF